MGSAYIQDASGTLATGNSTLLLAENKFRKYLIIQNVGSVAMWINFTNAATAGAGSVELLPGGIGVLSFETNYVPTDAVYGIGNGAVYTLKYA
jgi:hypothetical protein